MLAVVDWCLRGEGLPTLADGGGVRRGRQRQDGDPDASRRQPRHAAAPRQGWIPLFTALLLCVKTHPVDDSQHGPSNQPDTPREWLNPSMAYGQSTS